MSHLSRLCASLRRPVMLALCALFVLVLWTPTLVTLSGLTLAAPIKEKRAAAALPPLPTTIAALPDFPAAFSAYYADSFGLRDLLIRTQGWWKYRLFNTGNDIDQHTGVVIGKDGWFFGGGLTLDTVRRTKSFDGAQLDEIVSFFASRSDWAAVRGIPFLLAFVPASGEVYPEYLPDWLYPIQETSRLDQLMPRLAEVPGIQCLSLLDALCEGKSAARVFNKTDGHWNGAGAYYGAARIAGKTYEALGLAGTFSEDAPVFTQASGRAGASAEFLAIDNVLTEERISAGQTTRVKKSALDKKNKGVILYETPKRANAPSVFVFHDSFGGYGFDKAFPQHFSTTYFAHYLDNKFDMRLVQQCKPDAVVVLLSETRLQDYWKFNLPVLQPAVRTFRTLPWRVEMSSGGNSELIAGGGWAPPEADGCRTHPRTAANRSYLVFPKPRGAMSLTVSCRATAGPGTTDTPQRVLAHANGVQVGEWAVGKETAEYRAEIPKSAACKERLMTVSFAVPTADGGNAPGTPGTKTRVGITVSTVVVDALK